VTQVALPRCAATAIPAGSPPPASRAGALGILIPPSVVLVVYAILAN
jgi:TRAP-type C4-dicarboxylate transport system permease large subunit